MILRTEEIRVKILVTVSCSKFIEAENEEKAD